MNGGHEECKQHIQGTIANMNSYSNTASAEVPVLKDLQSCGPQLLLPHHSFSPITSSQGKTKKTMSGVQNFA